MTGNADGETLLHRNGSVREKPVIVLLPGPCAVVVTACRGAHTYFPVDQGICTFADRGLIPN
jgi:hypothetical protein